MIGLVILLALALYLAISVAVVRWVVKWAKRKGRRPLLWGILAGVVMYNLVFWDLIPTYAVYKYYCITKAGFWVYKTPEQWKAENPGVAETLTWREMSQTFEDLDGTWGYFLNERFVWNNRKMELSIVPVAVFDRKIVDKNNRETVVRKVSVGSGYSGGNRLLRFWTNFGSFPADDKDFGNQVSFYKKLGREVK